MDTHGQVEKQYNPYEVDESSATTVLEYRLANQRILKAWIDGHITRQETRDCLRRVSLGGRLGL